MEITDGGLAVDDRGQVSFINDFNVGGIKRFYLVENHQKGFVRAWHGHEKEAKYVFVTKGAILLCTRLLEGDQLGEDEEIKRVVLSAAKPQLAYIAPGLFNGFKTLTNDTQVMFFSTRTLEESKDDDIRRPASECGWVWEIEER